MVFLHAWPIYLGVAAAALPIVIHWLTRPRPVRLPLSTLRFVREALEQRRARHKLRDFAILSMRALAVLLLAWAMARPLIGERSLLGDQGISAARRIVVLDVSQSMAAGRHGVEAFERARSRAADYLAYQPGLRANLIEAGATARPLFDQPSTNFQALRDQLARSTVRPERLNLQRALDAAARMVAAPSAEAAPTAELVLVSDFQQSNWASADFSVLPANVQIQFESVAPAETPANLAIVRVGCQGRPALGREVRLEVEVGNFSTTTRPATVELAIGNAVYRLSGSCPPHSRTVLTENAALSDVGWQAGHARLVDADDALTADNRRPFALDVRPAANFALLTRQHPEEFPSSSFYLERALVPLPGRHARSPLKRFDPAQLDDDSLLGSELIVLDHPGKLSTKTIQLLSNLMRRGRSILYMAAEPVDAANLKLLATSAGADLQLPVEFLPPAPSQRRELTLADIKQDQAPFSVFGDQTAAVIRPLRFEPALATRRRERAASDDLVASYNNGSAAMVVTSSGAGTLAVMNVDLVRSNLPASGAFVPLIGELVERLLSHGRRNESVESGEPAAVYLPPEVASTDGLRVVATPADASANPGELVVENAGVLWRTSAAGAPAVYEVKRGPKTVFAVAAETPAEESDLRPIDPATLKDRLAAGRSVYYRGSDSDSEERDKLWTYLALGCAIAMLMEFALLRVFRT